MPHSGTRDAVFGDKDAVFGYQGYGIWGQGELNLLWQCLRATWACSFLLHISKRFPSQRWFSPESLHSGLVRSGLC